MTKSFINKHVFLSVITKNSNLEIYLRIQLLLKYEMGLKGLQRELSHLNVLFSSFQGYSDIRESTFL